MDVDLKIDTARDLCFDGDDIDCVAGIDLVKQRVVMDLRTFSTEPLMLLFDEGGTDYYNYILVDQPRTTLVEALFRSRILGDDDIERIAEFAMAVDTALRKVTVTFKAISTYGVVDASTVLP